MKSKTTTAFTLDLRRPLKNGEYPIKLRITNQRKTKYYSTGKSASKTSFIKIFAPNAKGYLKEYNFYLREIIDKANENIGQLVQFSFTAFEKLFYNKTTNPKNVYEAFEIEIEYLLDQERIGTMNTYKDALSSLRSFKSNLFYDQITESFLEKYEKFMLEKGRSLTTVGIYLRNLRTIYNKAIKNRTISSIENPFGDENYQIPTGRNFKKALRIEDIEKIFKHKPTTLSQERARDYWVFSYLGNGLNIKDIANLKYGDINGNSISFIRKKTARKTRSRPILISFPLDSYLKKIIQKWGNKPKLGTNYIFDIHTPGMTAVQEKKREKAITKMINIYMKQIAIACEIDETITTYTARHSFSTVLMLAGAPLAYLKSSLGHTEMRSTESYIGGFEDNMKAEINKNLTKFTK